MLVKVKKPFDFGGKLYMPGDTISETPSTQLGNFVGSLLRGGADIVEEVKPEPKKPESEPEKIVEKSKKTKDGE